MINLTKPIHVMVLTICISFVISAGILYLAKPSWIQRLNSKGKPEISPILLCSFSMTFALASGVVALLMCTKQRGTIEKKEQNIPPTSAMPSIKAAQAFADGHS